jgi:alpha-mannosidase
LAVFSRGLPEYQLCADGRGWSLAVTLLRGVGRVHARDSLTIDRRAWGIPFRTPAAQCHGIQRYSLAVRPFADDWASDDVDVDAERFVFGYEAEQPVSGAGLRADPVLRGLEGSGIIASALKPAEIGQGIVLRLWNNRSETRGARLELSDRIRSAARTTLREEVRDDLPVEEAAGRHVTVELAPWEIVTLRLGL